MIHERYCLFPDVEMMLQARILCRLSLPKTEQSGWNGADAGLAVLAYAVGLIANAECVTDADSDADALIQVGKEIKKVFPEFALKVRSSL